MLLVALTFLTQRKFARDFNCRTSEEHLSQFRADLPSSVTILQ